jgi:hypothetical protein
MRVNRSVPPPTVVPVVLPANARKQHLGDACTRAERTGEQTWTARISARLDGPTMDRLLTLVAVASDEADGVPENGENAPATVLGLIKSEPGNVSLDSMVTTRRAGEKCRQIEPAPCRRLCHQKTRPRRATTGGKCRLSRASDQSVVVREDDGGSPVP